MRKPEKNAKKNQVVQKKLRENKTKTGAEINVLDTITIKKKIVIEKATGYFEGKNEKEERLIAKYQFRNKENKRYKKKVQNVHKRENETIEHIIKIINR